MADLTPVVYKSVLLMFEFASGTYTHPCTINGSKAISFSKTFNERRLPNCDDPDEPDTIEDVLDSRRCTINGDGVLDLANLAALIALHESKDPIGCKAVIGGVGGQTVTGLFHLETFDVNVANKEYAQGSIAGKFTGDYVITINT